MSKSLCLGCSLIAVTALLVAGCTEPQPAAPPAAPPAESSTAADAAPADPEIAQAMAELPETDRAAAAKQKVCPVTGEPLGSMGKPYKVRVKDRDVFLCCEGCEEAITSEPDKYLAKLPVP